MSDITLGDIQDALAEWERRYREEPDRFESDFARLAKGTTCEDYGQVAGLYLWELLHGGY